MCMPPPVPTVHYIFATASKNGNVRNFSRTWLVGANLLSTSLRLLGDRENHGQTVRAHTHTGKHSASDADLWVFLFRIFVKTAFTVTLHFIPDSSVYLCVVRVKRGSLYTELQRQDQLSFSSFSLADIIVIMLTAARALCQSPKSRYSHFTLPAGVVAILKVTPSSFHFSLDFLHHGNLLCFGVGL